MNEAAKFRTSFTCSFSSLLFSSASLAECSIALEPRAVIYRHGALRDGTWIPSSYIFHQRCSHQIHEPNRNEDQNWKEQHTQIGFLQHKRVADIGDTIQGHKLQKRQEGPAEAVVILFHQNTKGWMCSKVRVFGYQPKSVQLRPCVQTWSRHNVFLGGNT